MKKEIADKWVAALRSGKYIQAMHALDKGKEGQCCLGVLCRVLGKKGTETEIDGYPVLAYDDETEVLPDSVIKEAGMASRQGYYQGRQSMLAEQNDSGLSFARIADIIEQHWEEL